MKFIFVFVIFTQIILTSQSSSNSTLMSMYAGVDVRKEKPCVDKWRASHASNFTKRYDELQIAWWLVRGVSVTPLPIFQKFQLTKHRCSRGRMWTEMANSRADRPIAPDADLTRKQKNWLFDLRTCQGADCLTGIRDKKLLPTTRPTRPGNDTRADLVGSGAVVNTQKAAAAAILATPTWRDIRPGEIIFSQILN